MSHQVLNKLLASIRGTMFSLICNEYKDCSNKELLRFCLRWVTDNLDVFEHFMGFYEIPYIKSSTIVSVIKDIMIRFQLQFDKCRDPCYDRASNMLGKKSGVAMQIKELQSKLNTPTVMVTLFHSLLKKLQYDQKSWETLMGVAEEIVVLIKYSPKRENVLGCIKDQVEFESEPEEKANDIIKPSQT